MDKSNRTNINFVVRIGVMLKFEGAEDATWLLFYIVSVLQVFVCWRHLCVVTKEDVRLQPNNAARRCNVQNGLVFLCVPTTLWPLLASISLPAMRSQISCPAVLLQICTPHSRLPSKLPGQHITTVADTHP
jgi:hypothetical protein